jgi:hypothetical protein
MDAWLGGDLGTLYRWDGSNWNEQASGSALAFLHIRGWSASKVFAMKGDERLWSWDGMAWTMPAVSPSGNRLWINGDREQFVVGSNSVFRWTGTTWTNTYISATAAFTTSPTNGWTFSATDIYRFNGTGWDYRW